MTSRSDRVPEHALSIMQPWASAIVDGPKRIENRTWRPFQLKDGPFAIWIHASLKPDRASLDHVRRARALPPLGDPCHPTPALYRWGQVSDAVRFASPAWGLTCGAIIGAAVVEDVRDGLDRLPDGQEGWWAGPLAWVLRDVMALAEPVRASGRLGLWRPTPEIQAACVARLPGGWHV